MCAAIVRRSAGDCGGRRNKQKNENLVIQICMQKRKQYNIILLSGINFIIIHSVKCRLSTQFFCLLQLINAVNIHSRFWRSRSFTWHFMKVHNNYIPARYRFLALAIITMGNTNNSNRFTPLGLDCWRSTDQSNMGVSARCLQNWTALSPNSFAPPRDHL